MGMVQRKKHRQVEAGDVGSTPTACGSKQGYVRRSLSGLLRNAQEGDLRYAKNQTPSLIVRKFLSESQKWTRFLVYVIAHVEHKLTNERADILKCVRAQQVFIANIR